MADAKEESRFHALSRRILRYADRGLATAEFIRRITKLFAAFSACEITEVSFKDHDKYLRCRAEGARLSMSFEPSWNQDRTRPLPRPALMSEGVYPSVLVVPVVADRRRLGSIHLKSLQTDYFPPGIVKLYTEVASTLGLAIVHVRVRSDLQERIKELTCLYGIARIAAEPDTRLEEVLQRVAHVLPAAWLYPEIAGARIAYDGHVYKTPGYRNEKGVQRAHFMTDGKRRGVVEVAYFEERPALDEGPFLREERKLLEIVAEEIAALISRREAERENLRLEDQLRHSDRLATLGQLAAGIAHEMNEPLAAVVGFAQLAMKCPGLPLQADRDIGKVLSASLQAREIVRRLLTFTRQTPPRKMDVDLNRVVTEGLKFFETRCAKSGVRLVVSLQSVELKVKGDPVQLTQVFVNVMANALQAMPGGGTLKVRTRRLTNSATLTIQDTGTGMAKEVLENIFTPFFTTKDVEEGTGLGLPVAYGIVSSHGGTLRFASRPGEGTKCVVTLPAGQTQNKPGARKNG